MKKKIGFEAKGAEAADGRNGSAAFAEQRTVSE